MTNKCKVITVSKASEIPLKPINGKPTLVYWDTVCLAHPLRMALALSDFEEWYDVRISCGRSQTDAISNKKEWFQAKPKFREAKVLEFPNLPYYLDGNDVRLVQSDAILRYLGKQHDLLGERNDVPEHVIDMLLEEVRDMDYTLIRLSYEEGAVAVAEWLRSDDLAEKLEVWSNYVNDTDGDYVTGMSLTVVDLKLYTFFYKFQQAQADLMMMLNDDDVPSTDVPALPFWVPAYMQRIETATPQLEAYLHSPEMRIPINNPHALFGNL